MKKRNLLGLFMLLGAFTAQVFAQDLTPVYERTGMELNGVLAVRDDGQVPTAEAVPAAEAAQLLNANALTVAIEYSIDEETFKIKNPMPFVGVTTNSTAPLCALWVHERYGVSYYKKTSTNPFDPNAQAYIPNTTPEYDYIGSNQTAVYVITTSNLTIYSNGAEVATASGDFTFNGKNELYIGGVKEGNNSFASAFKGTIHSIRFYDQALTAEQINGLFAAAIEGVNADNKAVYYADGVVYNNAGEIAIYDITGKLVVRTGAATVDTQDFANGIYIVRSAKGTVKIVK